MRNVPSAADWATLWPPTSLIVARPTGTPPTARVTRPATSRPWAGAATGIRLSATTAAANTACLLMRCLLTVRMDAAGGVPPGTETSEGPAALHEQSGETLIPGSDDSRNPGKRHVTAIPMSLTLRRAGNMARVGGPRNH